MDKTLIPHIASLYGFGPGDLKLLDLFFVQYSNRQPELKAHRDGCLISFNILLNDPSEFDGGGTLFLPDNLVQPQKGECVVHDSRLLHAGHPITQGERKILVGFVETRDSFKFQHLIT
ncbi:hypothetical protein EDD86DRAFT_194539 [Gorgonomyces haynaldii]|nr:hypothetical protein EDD86DRAFT_194539 [Gorgonomyces haynaldii]